MQRKPPTEDTSWESDAVWALLDEAPPVKAGSRFAENTLRAARTAPEPGGWWHRLLSPAPLAGLAAGAAVAVAVFFLNVGPPESTAPVAVKAPEERFAAIQEVAETEMLFAAVDHMDEFSDHELASLIGF